MKKKIITIVFCMMLTIGLIACGNKKNEKNTGNSVDSEKTNTETEIGETGDSVEVSYESLLKLPETNSSDFVYEINGDECVITSYIGNELMVVVPDSIEGKPVVDIGETFAADTGNGNGGKVVGLKLGKYVKTIQTASFLSLSSVMDKNKNGVLKYFVGGESLDTIDFMAFSGCGELNTVDLSAGVETIDVSAFSTSNTGVDIYIPDDFVDYDFVPFIEMTIHVKSGSKAEQYLISHEKPTENDGDNNLEYCNVKYVSE